MSYGLLCCERYIHSDIGWLLEIVHWYILIDGSVTGLSVISRYYIETVSIKAQVTETEKNNDRPITEYIEHLSDLAKSLKSFSSFVVRIISQYYGFRVQYR